MRNVCVIGGGAAGMMAAYAASQKGHSVILLEKNEKLGKKLFITGKGRCNLTNACATEDFFDHVVSNPKFLYSAVYTFSNMDVMDFFEKNGLPLKVERGNRVFPASDKSSDVIKTLENCLKRQRVEICLRTRAAALEICEQKVCGVWAESFGKKRLIPADAVIVATGGLSYASTGSDGDGLGFAKDSGHKLEPCLPSLVALETAEDYGKELMGLSLKNVDCRLYHKDRLLFCERGEMLFTHFGVSGPLILSASTQLPKLIRKQKTNPFSGQELLLTIDLKPALTEEQLKERILRDFSQTPNRAIKNVLGGLLPAALIPVMLRICKIPEEKSVNLITKQERAELQRHLKRLPLHIAGVRGFQEAIITSGGVRVSGINPSTMESKVVRELYFAGEVIDVDAVTGGYNLQIAWSTGYLAGSSLPV